MSVEELWSWIELIMMGKTDTAYGVLLSRMNNEDLLTTFDKINDEWAELNEANSQRLNLQRSALLAVLRVTFQIALALVGL